MEKTFKLPKQFATKWVQALRSGQYTQLEGQLIEYNKTLKHEVKESDDLLHITSEHYNTTYDTTKGCCLGIAAVVLGATGEQIGTGGMPRDIDDCVLKVINYPEELVNKGDSMLPNILAVLNDGTNRAGIDNYVEQFPNLVFRQIPDRPEPENDGYEEDGYQIRYTFEQIAEWVEDNVEFYEDEGVQEVHETT